MPARNGQTVLDLHCGERVSKRRLTHFQSFMALPGSQSLNYLTDRDKFPTLVYGFCLHRILYQMISLRTSFPTDRIMITKFDFSKAYHRIHYDGISAVRCLAVHDEQAYMQLRLSFGGKACPASWCPTSEVVTDLAKDIFVNSLLDTSVFHSDDLSSIPSPERIDSAIPFAPALLTMVLPPARPFGSADFYIDDIIATFIDTEENMQRAIDVVPLAISVLGHPSSPS